MSESKTIQFNPELFKVSGGNKTRKQGKNKGKDIKYKNNNIHNKTTKHKLLKYIREQQELKYKKLFDNNDNRRNSENNNQVVLNDENNVFENSVNYLKSVSEKLQQNHNQPTQKMDIHKTIKHRPSVINSYLPNSGFINTINPVIHTELPDNFNQHIEEHPIDKSNIKLSTKYNLTPPPKWGCLRNGNLQTYREFMKNQTQRNRYNTPPIISQPLTQTVTTPSPINMNDQQREVMIIKKNVEKQNKINGAQSNNKLKYLKQKKVIRRTYKVGKSKYQPEVSILISNKTIRNNITTKTHLLKQVPIQEVKQYLINKGLIRVGTISPNDVLRMMYESSILVGGDIQNHNPDNLLYNYFTKND